MSEFALERLEMNNVQARVDELGERGLDSSAESPVQFKLALRSEPDATASAIFAGALMTGLGQVPLRVEHEPSETVVDYTIRSGLAFALRQRMGPTGLGAADARFAESTITTTWTPGIRAFRGAMFASSGAPTALVGPRHALFINPHRTSSLPGPASITRLIRRWITKRLQGSSETETAVERIAFAIDQLLLNVTEHAVTDETPSVSSIARLRIRDQGSAPTVTLVVVDTGTGVLKTLRPKLEQPQADDLQLLTRLLKGELPGWGRARGIGLSRLAETVAGLPRARMALHVQGALATVDDDVEVAAATDQVRGSVVTVDIPLSS